ncbi:uncharacterized protein METZ01_LOCUS317571, partial [marine metagenome]
VDEVDFHFKKVVKELRAVKHILLFKKGLLLFQGKIQPVREPVHKLAELVTQVPVGFLFQRTTLGNQADELPVPLHQTVTGRIGFFTDFLFILLFQQ